MQRKLLSAFVVCAVVSTAAFGQFKVGAPKPATAGTFKPKEPFFGATKVGEHRFSLEKCAPPNPSFGPTEIFVYENSLGKFKTPSVNDLGAVDSGSANYTWTDGTNHSDRLTYMGYGTIADTEGHFVAKGKEVEVWAFMATDDDGNSFFVYLGVHDDVAAPQGRRFPMYYSWAPPDENAVTHRLVSKTGTTRH